MDLLLVHGALGDAAQLDPLRQLLAESHRVEVVEREGHGASPMSTGGYSIPRFSANLVAAMDRAGFERAAVFGYSMGGYVALALAADQPQRVTAVTTLGTKLAWTPETAAREVGRLDPAAIRAKVPRFAEQLEARHRGAGGWESVLSRTAQLLTDLGSSPVVDAALLTRIAQPVRLMVGDRDALVSVDETRAAARQLPKGELVVLPGTPHPIEQVRLPLIAGMIDDFLGGLSGP